MPTRTDIDGESWADPLELEAGVKWIRAPKRVSSLGLFASLGGKQVEPFPEILGDA